MPTSGDLWNPANWAQLVKEIGVGAFFFLFFMVVFIVFVGFVVKRLFGENGWVEKFWVRMDKFLECIEANSATTAETLKQHLANCDLIHHPGGACNVEDLREAGHSFAEMGRKIGEKVGADVGSDAEVIHKVLRSKPA